MADIIVLVHSDISVAGCLVLIFELQFISFSIETSGASHPWFCQLQLLRFYASIQAKVISLLTHMFVQVS